jgi:hypothetical protein
MELDRPADDAMDLDGPSFADTPMDDGDHLEDVRQKLLVVTQNQLDAHKRARSLQAETGKTLREHIDSMTEEWQRKIRAKTDAIAATMPLEKIDTSQFMQLPVELSDDMIRGGWYHRPAAPNGLEKFDLQPDFAAWFPQAPTQFDVAFPSSMAGCDEFKESFRWLARRFGTNDPKHISDTDKAMYLWLLGHSCLAYILRHSSSLLDVWHGSLHRDSVLALFEPPLDHYEPPPRDVQSTTRARYAFLAWIPFYLGDNTNYSQRVTLLDAATLALTSLFPCPAEHILPPPVQRGFAKLRHDDDAFAKALTLRLAPRLGPEQAGWLSCGGSRVDQRGPALNTYHQKWAGGDADQEKGMLKQLCSVMDDDGRKQGMMPTGRELCIDWSPLFDNKLAETMLQLFSPNTEKLAVGRQALAVMDGIWDPAMATNICLYVGQWDLPGGY